MKKVLEGTLRSQEFYPEGGEGYMPMETKYFIKENEVTEFFEPFSGKKVRITIEVIK